MASSGEHRTIYNWFMHFDVIASMMAGHNTTLSRDWSEANLTTLREIQRSDPTDTSAKVYCAMCAFQDLAVDASIMSAKRSANQLTLEDFTSDATNLLDRCHQWWEDLDDALLRDAVTLAPKHYDDKQLKDKMLYAQHVLKMFESVCCFSCGIVAGKGGPINTSEK